MSRWPLAALAVLLLALPATASATTTATRSGNAITITGDDGPNDINVNNNGNFIMYEDRTGPGIVAGAGCFQESPTLINCGVGGVGLVATVTLGGGDDNYNDGLPRSDWPRVDLDAGDGNDTVLGSWTNDDVLRGGAGNDKIYGAGGRDQLDGGPGDDELHGGSGDDTVIGGPGRDSLNGDGTYSNNGLASGNDTLQARDGEIDQVACGFGADVAVLDAGDVVDLITDCEQVDRAAGATPPPPATGGGPATGPGAGAPAAPPLTVGLGRPKASALALGPLLKGKAMTFTVSFSAPCAAVAGLVVRKAEARRLHLGQKDTIIASDAGAVEAGTFSASLRLKKTYRTKLRRARRVKATLQVVCVAGPQTAAQKSLALTLTR